MSDLEFATFISRDVGLSFKYPKHWKTRKEPKNTYLFYDELFGTFRITAIEILNDQIDPEAYLTKRFKENESLNPEWIIINNLRFIYYKTAENDTIIHFFMSFKNQFLLLFSFSYSTAFEGTEDAFAEIKKVKNIFSTINDI